MNNGLELRYQSIVIEVNLQEAIIAENFGYYGKYGSIQYFV